MAYGECQYKLQSMCCRCYWERSPDVIDGDDLKVQIIIMVVLLHLHCFNSTQPQLPSAVHSLYYMSFAIPYGTAQVLHVRRRRRQWRLEEAELIE